MLILCSFYHILCYMLFYLAHRYGHRFIISLYLFRPRHSITYVDAAYCYRLSSVVSPSVCLSVSLSHPWALQNGWTDRDAVWVEDSGGPREPCIRWGTFSTLTVLIGHQEEHCAWDAGMVICLEWGADDCIWSCWCHSHSIIKIQIGLTFLMPASQCCPGKEVVEWLSVCVCLSAYLKMYWIE